MTTDLPDSEALYINEQALELDIRKYLVHLAALARLPIVLGIHGRPQGIAANIHNALAVHEQHLISRREEIAGDEMTDPHNAASISAGRHELSNLIACMALPLASNTWANEVQIDLQIGHGLPPPYAPDGLAVCITFDCKQGVVRHRFAPEPEQTAPAPEHDVTLGMTVVVRPEKMAMRQMNEEGSRCQIMSLLQSDSALFRWTFHALLIMGNLQGTLENKIGAEQQHALNQVRNTMIAILLAIRVKREQDAAIGATAADQQIAPLMMPPIDQVRQALQAVRSVSPRLGMAIGRMEMALERLIPAVQTHAATHNQIASLEHEAAKQAMGEQHPTHGAPHVQHGPTPTPEEH